MHAGDMELIRQPMDFFGMNIYSAKVLRAAKTAPYEIVDGAPGDPHTLYLWKMVPAAL